MDLLLPKPGSYVIAVSGGVDSVVLLDLLRQDPALRLTVAHFDHGIRDDSEDDRRFVQNLTATYRLPFVYKEGRLGGDASEAEAREARYAFLRQAVKASQARAIITAHHQDDLLETAILNMLRGTGRKGLTSLKNRSDIVRPLLKVPKNEILDYARTRGLDWRDDPSNQDTKYLRNHVRHQIMPRFSAADREKLVDLLAGLETTNQELDDMLAAALGTQKPDKIERLWFNQLPHSVAKEMMATWLRENGVRGFDKPMLERLVTAAKTAPAGKRFPILKGVRLEVEGSHLALAGIER
ncbi:MAG TPA: tRNA lysidine(34) synthetase TilS [Candidatus Saccharimonadia bacterium]|nr:tRNA lysidine(34) synthetase TilS [Candidatus Saccharimonadia bacterium]